MASVIASPQVLFPPDYDEQSEAETPSRGYLSHVVVQAEDGSRYEMFFIDPVRLGQELDEDARDGLPFFAEPNMVVLPRVSTATIEQAVRALWQQGFFEHLKPMA